MTLTFNPYIQTNAPGSFNVESRGLIVGTAYPDPATRFALAGGTLATTETLPMWGGVGISENIPWETGAHPDMSLGSVIARATAYANLTGFSVYDQNWAAVNSPQSPVPCSDIGGEVNFYRLGSGARVALEIDPTLVTLEGGLVTAQVSWDFTNQRIIAFATTALPVKVLTIQQTGCYTATRNASTGFVTWNRNAAAAVCVL